MAPSPAPSLGSLDISLPKLLVSRLLVQAQSGGGKSHLLRRLIEQVALGVQVIVIDPEGEFASIRKKFDFILAGANGPDAVANPGTAAALARAIWSSGASAIVDIYDLKAHDRVLFVRRFLEALINAPKGMWHPTLVVIDEVHIFAPQVGQAESLNAVIDLATRGRKRGLALVAATQRLSKLHKDVAAELQNKLIGRTGLDVDVARAGDELGMPKKEAWTALRSLQPGDFYAYGPALSESVVLTTIGPVQTTHPKAGGRVLEAPPPASQALMATLAKLEGIQRSEEQDEQDLPRLRQRVRELERQLKNQVPTPEAYEAVCTARNAWQERAEGLYAAYQATLRDIQELAGGLLARMPRALRDLDGKEVPRLVQNISREDLKKAMEFNPPLHSPAVASTPIFPKSGQTVISASVHRKPSAAVSLVIDSAPATAITGPEQRILDAVAWMESIGVPDPENTTVAFLAGYAPGGGAYGNPRGRLATNGLIEYPGSGRVRLTEAGRAKARFPAAITSVAELHERVLAKLAGPEKRILTPLLECYPDSMANDDLAAAAGYTAGGGAFGNPRGRLRSLGLIDYKDGQARARDILFPKGEK